MTDERKALLLGVLAVLIWSTVASAFKVTLREIEPLTMLFISSVASIAVISVFVCFRKKGAKVPSMSRRKSLKLMGIGLLNPFIYYVLLFEGYDRLPAQIAQSINYSWPIMLTVLSIMVLKQKISKWSLIGISIGFVGILIVSTRGFSFSGGSFNGWGLLFAAGSAVCWAVFWTLNLKIKGDPARKLFYNFIGGSIPISAACLIFRPQMPSLEGWGGAIYIGVFEMGLTFILWLKALSLTEDTSKVSMLIYLSPFISLFFIALIVGESILLSTMIGLSLIVAGIIIQRKGKGPKKD